MDELKQIIKTIGMTKDEALQEAEFVEEYYEWSYPALIGFGAEELRAAAATM